MKDHSLWVERLWLVAVAQPIRGTRIARRQQRDARRRGLAAVSARRGIMKRLVS